MFGLPDFAGEILNAIAAFLLALIVAIVAVAFLYRKKHARSNPKDTDSHAGNGRIEMDYYGTVPSLDVVGNRYVFIIVLIVAFIAFQFLCGSVR